MSDAHMQRAGPRQRLGDRRLRRRPGPRAQGRAVARRPRSMRSARGASSPTTSPRRSARAGARSASPTRRRASSSTWAAARRSQMTGPITWSGMPAWILARSYHLAAMPGIERKLRGCSSTGTSACCSAATRAELGGWRPSDGAGRRDAEGAGGRVEPGREPALRHAALTPAPETPGGVYACRQMTSVDRSRGSRRCHEGARGGSRRRAADGAQRAAEGREGGRAGTSWPCCAASASAGWSRRGQFRNGGRDELADERGGRGQADRGLPARGDGRGRAARDRRGRSPRRARRSPKDIGLVMKATMAKVAGKADGKRVSALVREELDAVKRRSSSPTTSRPSWPEAATPSCARWRATRVRALPARQHLTLDGEPAAVRGCRDRRARAGGADRAGPRDRARDDRRGQGALDQHDSPGRDPRGRRLAPPLEEDRAEDDQPEAIRRLDPAQHDHVRRSARPAPARRSWRSRWPPPRCRAATSTASSSRAPRSRPASGSASCRAI